MPEVSLPVLHGAEEVKWRWELSTDLKMWALGLRWVRLESYSAPDAAGVWGEVKRPYFMAHLFFLCWQLGIEGRG